jgi:hypothetical protein
MMGPTALLTKSIAAVGGAPAAGGILVVGAVAGGVIGATVGGAFDSPDSANELAIYPCPNAGPPLLHVPLGQHVLATGKSADGSWIRIHFPAPGRTEAWVQAAALKFQGPIDSLSIGDCVPEVALLIPAEPSATDTITSSFEPTPAPIPGGSVASTSPEPGKTAAPPTATPRTTTAPPNSTPTPTPTAPPTPRPTPTPTPVPDTTPPTLSAPAASTDHIFRSGHCNPQAVTFSVAAVDDRAGPINIKLWFQIPGGLIFKSRTMTPVVGAANRYSAIIDATSDGPMQSGKLNYYFAATDAAGNKARLPTSGSQQPAIDVIDPCLT